MKATLTGSGCLGRVLVAGVLSACLGCGTGAYEERLQATIDALNVARIQQIQDDAGKPAGGAAPGIQLIPPPGSAPATPPGNGANAAAPAAQAGGLSPVGQSIVAPLE